MSPSLLIAAGISAGLFGLMWACDRWVQPRLTRRWVKKTLERIRSGDSVPPVKTSDFRISTDSAGIAVAQFRPTVAPLHFIAWSTVVRVVAFKRDFFSVDCICLAIFAADGTMVEVNEEMEGWESFTETLPENLPGCNRWSESFFQIAFPAFATNETQIFERTAFQCQEKQQQRNESPPP